MNLKIISAGAGSGKTYRLTQEMTRLMASGEVRASGIIATTFTKKAAAELQERVRVRLLEEGRSKEANELTNALIGTVHGLGVKLLKRFAFEAGVSPQVDILADDDQQVMFNQSLSMVLNLEKVSEMERLSNRLGLQKSDRYSTDWRRLLKDLTEIVRTNDFSAADVEKSKQFSFESFRAFLDEPISRSTAAWNQALLVEMEEAVVRLENNGDATKVTAEAVKALKELIGELNVREELFWYNWVKISKLKVGSKSREDFSPLLEFANSHLAHQGFQDDVKSFIFNIFDLATQAIHEFDHYKKSRGLIDYTDMEVLVKRLLDQPLVQEVLSEELDLLMVDEFQDTSPMQLEIFLKLSRLAKYAIWVGDPKQSIYGFRGAEPALMEAVIKHTGGLQKDNILAHSWRSREDIVYASNAIFTKAFEGMPAEQVALLPKRCKLSTPESSNRQDEPSEADQALFHWHFKYDGEGRAPGKEWLNNCIAATLEQELSRGLLVLPKGENDYRKARPGDVAILCRSNHDCQDMAEALHRAGLRAAISRAGLLSTAEAKLILACLKFVLNKYDTLSIAEILLLAGNMNTEDIIEDRAEFLQKEVVEKPVVKWGEGNDFIKSLNKLRPEVAELSGTEILYLLLEELDLKRIIATWGNTSQRMANVDMLCSFAIKYEETCNRLHSAASLGGLLLWFNDLENNGLDTQGSGENSDAVNVLTYHRSKGLEYPIVVCHNLENTLRDEVWGFSIVPERPDIDLGNLLGNRWLRFWVNPYADLAKNTILEERLSTSDVKAKKRKKALQEEVRLLYVGITRARDYLIFPTRQKPTLWLNRVCHNGQEENPALNPASDESAWEWNGQLLGIATKTHYFPNDFGSREPQPKALSYWAGRAGRRAYPVFETFPDGPLKHTPYQIEELLITSPLKLPEILERKTIAKAVTGFIVADDLGLPIDTRLEMASGFLKRHEITPYLDNNALVMVSNGLHQWLQSNFTVKSILKRYPVRQVKGGGSFHTFVDIIVETGDGLNFVLLSDFIGNKKHLQKKVLEYGPVIQHTADILGEIFDLSSVTGCVYFLLSGTCFVFKPNQIKKGPIA
ncbi:MAG: UvrD-helicase domain-containing protein [Lewinellaceae bacterium]|nr:UvrD-helicase domain-containing protein [Saprospiraceae bacterium]MCB9341195.1 UvrD-helicase domain-containing protein [Lewinellaceae bacterium]